MAKVTSAPLPPESDLHSRFTAGDFLDCYSVRSNTSPRKAAEIITDFPSWARSLVALRGVLTAPFGLKNTAPETAPGEVRDIVGIFPVQSDTASELIAGFDDRHLEFAVAVLQRQGRVYLATWVHPHNIGGRIYLALIMPFHILIARNALARVARHGAGISDGAAVGSR